MCGEAGEKAGALRREPRGSAQRDTWRNVREWRGRRASQHCTVLSGQPCPYSSRQRDESRNWPAPRIKVGEIR